MYIHVHMHSCENVETFIISLLVRYLYLITMGWPTGKKVISAQLFVSKLLDGVPVHLCCISVVFKAKVL